MDKRIIEASRWERLTVWETGSWGIFQTLGVNPSLPHCRQILYQLNHQGSTHIVKAMVFPIVMYRCKSWTIKKAEHQKIDPFKLWCWRRLLRVSWTTRRSNQSILKESNSEYSWKGLMLKLQYFSHLMRRGDSIEKILMLGKIEDRRRRR